MDLPLPLPESGFVSLLSDYGFKVSFANEKDTTFLKMALTLLMKTNAPVSDVKLTKNEFTSLTEFSRNGLYDVRCEDKKGSQYIVEMQVDNLAWLIERLLYYASQLISLQVFKGKGGFKKLKPVYCICIVNHALTDHKGFYHKYQLRDEGNQTLTDKVTFVIIELSKFHKKINQLDDPLDELLFTMKHVHKYKTDDPDVLPSFWQKPEYQALLRELNMSNLSPERRANLQITMGQIMAIEENKALEIERAKRSAARKARKELKEEVKHEVREEINQAMVISAIEKGFEDALIVKLFEINLDEVQALRQKVQGGIS